MAGALLVLRVAVEQKLGRRVGLAFVALTVTQFHLPFYASRPLANTYALIPTALALAAVLQRTRPRLAIALLTFTTVLLQPAKPCIQLPLAAFCWPIRRLQSVPHRTSRHARHGS